MSEAEVRAAAEEVRGLAVEMILARDTAAAADHAASMGLIAPDKVPEIRVHSSANP